ncbi:hypothetical protein BUQ74_11685 [Leptospira weilii serovar Heyan]|nr:hypothetical protein BUQ74_11685 [Leptospira weilii serovar Heyan]
MTSSAEERGAEFGGGKVREIFLYQKIILLQVKSLILVGTLEKYQFLILHYPKNLLNLWGCL